VVRAERKSGTVLERRPHFDRRATPDRLGVRVPSQAQGSSLLPLIRVGRTVRDHVDLDDAIVTSRWKYVRDGRLLFDLTSDPRERTNLASVFPNLVEVLDRRVRETTQADEQEHGIFAQGTSRSGSELLTADEKARLRALGYTGR